MEKGLGRTGVKAAVINLGLFGQVVNVLDGRRHPLGSQEGGEVGRVRRNHYQGEEPPDAGDDAGRHGTANQQEQWLQSSSHVF